MEVLSMLQVAVIVFAIAAVGGLLMAAIRFMGGANPPSWLAMGHGLLAAAGLTLALYAALYTGVPPLAKVGITLLVLAAAGGALLNLAYQQQQRLLPAPIVFGHAGLAVAGFGCTAVAAFLP